MQEYPMKISKTQTSKKLETWSDKLSQPSSNSTFQFTQQTIGVKKIHQTSD
jgi:hypothetical protein